MDKKLKEITVATDCGPITVQEYDDGIANGVHILFNGTIVAAVDCYRKESNQVKQHLPEEVIITDLKLDPTRDEDEQICDYLSNRYGYCIFAFGYSRYQDGTIRAYGIDWDTTSDDDEEPEARLLVYGPEGDECDEPNQVISLN